MKEENGGFQVQLSVTAHGISWTCSRDGIFVTNEIKIERLLTPRVESQPENSRLIIQYVKITSPAHKKIIARLAEVVFVDSYSECDAVRANIEKLLFSQDSPRPKRVLLFINPKSGFGKAVGEYEAVVSPLLTLCGVDVDAIVTKDAHHATEVLDTYDLSSIDAVVSMGGDGSISQVTNGLIRRSMKDSGKDIDDPSIEPEHPSLPVASIPCGSGNVVALYTSGALMDLETAILTIALGKTIPYDVVGMRHCGKHLGYANVSSGCGLVCNVFVWLEKFKWMGKHRYWLILPATWWFWRHFEVDIDYLPVSEDKCTNRLIPECQTPLADGARITDGPWPGWKTLHCRSCEVMITPPTMKDFFYHSQVGDYQKPVTSPGNAVLDVYLTERFRDYVNDYQKLYTYGRTHIERKHLVQIEVTEIRVRSRPGWGNNKLGLLMHVDGEPERLPSAAIEAKLHCGLVNFMCIDADLVRDSTREHESTEI